MPKDLKRPQSTPEDNVRNRLFVKKLRDLDQINDEIHFIDNKLLPAHNLGLVEKKMIKMKRFFSNYFPEKNQFIEFLGQNLGVSSEALPTTNISQQQFKKIITGLLEKVDQKVENRLLQGFFANFTYNKFGQVNVQSIADQLFNETDKEFYMRVMKRPKGPPPCYNGNEVAMIAVSDEEQALRK
jgi:hypothetical protein